MPTYQGLLIRDNYYDDGTGQTRDPIWISPDIIPYGTGTLTPQNAASTYAPPDIGQPVVNNLVNNIYVRAKNISSASMTGTVNLYYTKSSLFLYPTTWNLIQLPVPFNNLVTTAQPPSTTIPAGALSVVQAPFNLGGVPTGAHYCFICVVNNNGQPFTVPASFGSNAAFVLWVEQNANVAYRNIVLNAGSAANTTLFTTFGNANPTTSTFIFSLVGINLPAGTTWQASCNDTRLSGPFSANGSFSSSGTAGTQLDVPANVAGSNSLMSMGWTYTNPSGQPFPSNAEVKVNYYQIPTLPEPAGFPAEHLELERAVTRVHRVAATDAASADGFQTLPLILLGSVQIHLHP